MTFFPTAAFTRHCNRDLPSMPMRLTADRFSIDRSLRWARQPLVMQFLAHVRGKRPSCCRNMQSMTSGRASWAPFGCMGQHRCILPRINRIEHHLTVWSSIDESYQGSPSPSPMSSRRQPVSSSTPITL